MENYNQNESIDTSMEDKEDILMLDKGKEKEEEEFVNIEYDIASYPSDFTLRGLVDLFNKGDIEIPDYQREFVWSDKQSSLLIESFLIGLPVPPIFLYIDDNNKSLVIDGQQRLMSIVYFFEGYFGKENTKGKRQVFKLKGFNPKNKYFNKRFIDLEESDRRKLENAVLRAVNVRQLSPKMQNTSVYHIFERLNTGGTPLKPQEIRNCVFRSEFIDQLKELNTNQYWRNIIGKPIPDKFQTDVELILRAYAFSKYLARYQKPMKEFLNIVSKETSERSEDFTIRFNKTVKLIVERLPNKPFSTRGPLNTSMFDSIFCTLLNGIDNVPDNIDERYNNLMINEQFIEYTTAATTDETIIKKRFELVQQILFS